MLGNRLLVCIACHVVPERNYVLSLIKRFSTYPLWDVRIIVDTNVPFEFEGAETCVHHSLQHPWHLTWMHRRHFKEEIENYDWFMYVEDDMDIPFEAFEEYTKTFHSLWKLHYVPSFVRLEEFNNKYYVTDVTSSQAKQPIITIEGKDYISLTQPYHAFWIMPQKELKETMTKNFVRAELSRENAASYPMWELKRTPLVRIENGKISPLSYSYHLANNYAPFPNTPFGKIEINDLLK